MVRRLFVEKKPMFAVRAHELMDEMSEYLGIKADNVRVLIRYDIENVSDETYAQAKQTVFSEPPVDEVYEEVFPHDENDFCFTVEYLPGQYDQRADSAEQCVFLFSIYPRFLPASKETGESVYFNSINFSGYLAIEAR